MYLIVCLIIIIVLHTPILGSALNLSEIYKHVTEKYSSTNKEENLKIQNHLYNSKNTSLLKNDNTLYRTNMFKVNNNSNHIIHSSSLKKHNKIFISNKIDNKISDSPSITNAISNTSSQKSAIIDISHHKEIQKSSSRKIPFNTKVTGNINPYIAYNDINYEHNFQHYTNINGTINLNIAKKINTIDYGINLQISAPTDKYYVTSNANTFALFANTKYGNLILGYQSGIEKNLEAHSLKFEAGQPIIPIKSSKLNNFYISPVLYSESIANSSNKYVLSNKKDFSSIPSISFQSPNMKGFKFALNYAPFGYSKNLFTINVNNKIKDYMDQLIHNTTNHYLHNSKHIPKKAIEPSSSSNEEIRSLKTELQKTQQNLRKTENEKNRLEEQIEEQKKEFEKFLQKESQKISTTANRGTSSTFNEERPSRTRESELDYDEHLRNLRQKMINNIKTLEENRKILLNTVYEKEKELLQQKTEIRNLQEDINKYQNKEKEKKEIEIDLSWTIRKNHYENVDNDFKVTNFIGNTILITETSANNIEKTFPITLKKLVHGDNDNLKITYKDEENYPLGYIIGTSSKAVFSIEEGKTTAGHSFPAQDIELDIEPIEIEAEIAIAAKLEKENSIEFSINNSSANNINNILPDMQNIPFVLKSAEGDESKANVYIIQVPNFKIPGVKVKKQSNIPVKLHDNSHASMSIETLQTLKRRTLEFSKFNDLLNLSKVNTREYIQLNPYIANYDSQDSENQMHSSPHDTNNTTSSEIIFYGPNYKGIISGTISYDHEFYNNTKIKFYIVGEYAKAVKHSELNTVYNLYTEMHNLLAASAGLNIKFSKIYIEGSYGFLGKSGLIKQLYQTSTDGHVQEHGTPDDSSLNTTFFSLGTGYKYKDFYTSMHYIHSSYQNNIFDNINLGAEYDFLQFKNIIYKIYTNYSFINTDVGNKSHTFMNQQKRYSSITAGISLNF